MFGVNNAAAKAYRAAGFRHLCVNMNPNIYHDALNEIVDDVLGE